MSQSSNITKLFNKVVKNKALEQWPGQSLCVLLFGPSDQSKTRKESSLLNSDAEINLALRTAKELLFKSQESRGSSQGLIYCSIMQIYQNELTDLLSLPAHQADRNRDHKIPYFNESGAEHGSNFISGTHVVQVTGQIVQPVRSMQDLGQLIKVA